MNRPLVFFLFFLVSASFSAPDLDPSKFGEPLYYYVPTEALAIVLRTSCMKAECDKKTDCVTCMTLRSVLSVGAPVKFAKCLSEIDMNICIRRYRVR